MRLNLPKQTFTLPDGTHPLPKAVKQPKPPKAPKPKREAIGSRLRSLILERDGHACLLCGRTAQTTELHVDHVRPVAQGGKTAEDNLATLCKACNLGKGARRIAHLEALIRRRHIENREGTPEQPSDALAEQKAKTEQLIDQQRRLKHASTSQPAKPKAVSG